MAEVAAEVTELGYSDRDTLPYGVKIALSMDTLLPYPLGKQILPRGPARRHMNGV